MKFYSNVYLVYVGDVPFIYWLTIQLIYYNNDLMVCKYSKISFFPGVSNVMIIGTKKRFKFICKKKVIKNIYIYVFKTLKKSFYKVCCFPECSNSAAK